VLQTRRRRSTSCAPAGADEHAAVASIIKPECIGTCLRRGRILCTHRNTQRNTAAFATAADCSVVIDWRMTHVPPCRWQVAAEKEERAKEEAVRARKAAVQR
jgi:hypothetical protein